MINRPHYDRKRKQKNVWAKEQWQIQKLQQTEMSSKHTTVTENTGQTNKTVDKIK